LRRGEDLAALDRVAREIRGSVVEMSHRAGTPHLGSALSCVDLLVTAAQSVGQPFVVTLDDFHYLDEAPADLRQVLDGWLCRLPENCHLVLSGRTRPQPAVLPLMSARQEVATVSGADAPSETASNATSGSIASALTRSASQRRISPDPPAWNRVRISSGSFRRMFG